MSEPMNNFTPRAQQVLALARKEADRFNHNYVGTEHILLGLIKLGQGVPVSVLQKMGLDLETVRGAVEKQVGTGTALLHILNRNRNRFSMDALRVLADVIMLIPVLVFIAASRGLS